MYLIYLWITNAPSIEKKFSNFYLPYDFNKAKSKGSLVWGEAAVMASVLPFLDWFLSSSITEDPFLFVPFNLKLKYKISVALKNFKTWSKSCQKKSAISNTFYIKTSQTKTSDPNPKNFHKTFKPKAKTMWKVINPLNPNRKSKDFWPKISQINPTNLT